MGPEKLFHAHLSQLSLLSLEIENSWRHKSLSGRQ